MAAFNLARRIYIDDDERVCEITNMHDADANETDDPEDTVVVVVKRAENEWLTINVREDVSDAPIA